ncbi:MAG: glutathione S-transferase [Sphingomonadaceae bacterium]|nr:glutathione S-transferase [Sphingomonadaceae bacterium]
MTETADQLLELMGAPGSPYTRKMIAYLRYRRIRYAVHWGTGQRAPEGYPVPKVRLLPTFYFPEGDNGLEAVVDSTPIIRRLEREYPDRATIPVDPVLAFLAYLIEDYADEWGTKQMFHYRWAHRADAENAGPLLAYWANPSMAEAEMEALAANFAQRQIDRLYVVGSNEVTAATIEASYERLLAILDGLIEAQGYVLGERPSSADFALYGQLTQLVQVEPTSSAIAAKNAPRVRAWIDRMEDLSGLSVDESNWLNRESAGETLGPLLAEIGRVYAPFLLANAQAAMSGEQGFETEIDGRAWTQPTFPYQAKCLHWIREEFAALPADDQKAAADILAGTGCEALPG